MPELDIDLQGAETLADPFTTYNHLREHCPVFHNTRHSHDFFVATRYHDIKQVLADHQTWSNRYGTAPYDIRTYEASFMSDPPTHTAFRKMIQGPLSIKGIQKLMPDIERLANELIDQMLLSDSGDLHDDFAMPLPVQVMSLFLGLPPEDYQNYKRMSDEFMDMTFNPPDKQRAKQLLKELYSFFNEPVQKRKQILENSGINEPGPEHVGTVLPDDLISLLVVSVFEGRRLLDEEIYFTCMGLFIGGNETTTSLILNCVRRLQENHTLWQRLQKEPELIPLAIEESLRFDPPTLGMFRTSLCPALLHDKELPERTKLMFALVAANRDPAVFERPDEFSLDRTMTEVRQHMAFGGGVHACLGAQLARYEAAAALRILIERVPNLRLSNGKFQRIKPFNFWGPASMPASWV